MFKADENVHAPLPTNSMGEAMGTTFQRPPAQRTVRIMLDRQDERIKELSGLVMRLENFAIHVGASGSIPKNESTNEVASPAIVDRLAVIANDIESELNAAGALMTALEEYFG